MSPFFKLFRVDTPFDGTNRFQTSYILSPAVLAIIRLIISVYAFTTLIYKLVYDSRNDPHPNRHWSFFTNITYWGIAFYFLVSSFHGIVYSRTGTAPLQRWPRILQLLHGLFYSTVVIFPFIVTLVFWIILAPDSAPFATPFESWNNISTHAMNSLFAIFEIFVPRTDRPPWIHLPLLCLFLVGYLGVAYITYATQGFYTYGFLDPKNGTGMLLGYIFGVFAGTCIIFSVVWLLIWFREWLLSSLLGLEGKLAASHSGYEAGNQTADKEEMQV